MEEKVRYIAARYLENVKDLGDSRLRAKCPFHASKSAGRSFTVSLSQGTWHCFGCKKGGGLHQLLRDLGVDRALADTLLAGIRFRDTKSELPQVKFREQLHLPENILKAWEYLPEALLAVGFTEETLWEHEVGFDPKRRRIVFPIRDYLGNLVAISGRATRDWDSPRYKVYEADPHKGGDLFDVAPPRYTPRNRDNLWGFHRVYPHRYFEPDDNAPLVIVEGFKARMWLAQNGHQSVALMGSSLTYSQRLLIERVRGPVLLMLDREPGKQISDGSGACAALNIVNSVTAHSIKLCTYPEYLPGNLQPDSLTPEELLKSIQGAKTPGLNLPTNWSRYDHHRV